LLVVDAHDLGPWACLAPDLVTPSYAEARWLLSSELTDAADGSRAAAVVSCRTALLERTNARVVAVTLDVDGAVVLARDGSSLRTRAAPVPHSRATGAGDVYTAAFTLALAAGAPLVDAADVA